MLVLNKCYQSLDKLHFGHSIANNLVQIAKSVVCWLGRKIYKIDFMAPNLPKNSNERAAAQAEDVARTQLSAIGAVAGSQAVLADAFVRIFHLTARCVDGTRYPVEIASNEKVKRLRALCAEQAGLDPSRVVLVYDAKALEDSMIVGELNEIESANCIHMFQQLQQERHPKEGS